MITFVHKDGFYWEAPCRAPRLCRLVSLQYGCTWTKKQKEKEKRKKKKKKKEKIRKNWKWSQRHLKWFGNFLDMFLTFLKVQNAFWNSSARRKPFRSPNFKRLYSLTESSKSSSDQMKVKKSAFWIFLSYRRKQVIWPQTTFWNILASLKQFLNSLNQQNSILKPRLSKPLQPYWGQ